MTARHKLHPLWIVLGTLHDAHGFVRRYNLEHPAERIPQAYTLIIDGAAGAIRRLRSIAGPVIVVECPSYRDLDDRDEIDTHLRYALRGRGEVTRYRWTRATGLGPWSRLPMAAARG